MHLSDVPFALSSYCVQGAHLRWREPNSWLTENGLCGGGDSPAQRLAWKPEGAEKSPATEHKRRGKAASRLRISGGQRRRGLCGYLQPRDPLRELSFLAHSCWVLGLEFRQRKMSVC